MHSVTPESIDSTLFAMMASIALIVAGIRSIGYAKKGREGLRDNIHGNVMLATSLTVLIVSIYLLHLNFDERIPPLVDTAMTGLVCCAIITAPYVTWWWRSVPAGILTVAINAALVCVKAEIAYRSTLDNSWVTIFNISGSVAFIGFVVVVVNILRSFE